MAILIASEEHNTEFYIKSQNSIVATNKKVYACLFILVAYL